MELPFEKTTEQFWSQRLCAPVTREETQEYRLTERMPDVGRVIAAWGQTVLRGKEWHSSHIVISGGVMVYVLYAPEGGGLDRIESWVPFSVRVEHDQGAQEGIIRAQSVLCGVDARTVSPRKLMLRCQIGLMVQTMMPTKADLAAPGALPEDIQILEQSYPMVLTRETGERAFLTDETVPLPDGPAERIIYCCISPRVTEQKVLGSRAVFRGVGDVHLLYQDPEQRLLCADVQVPFSQYLELEGDYEDGAEVSGMLCVSSLEAEPGQDGSLRVKCGLVSQYIINAPTVIRCVEDAYSPNRELELVQQELVLPAWLEEQVRQIELEEQAAGDEVPLDAIFFPEIPQVARQPGGAEIRVGGTFQTLCRGPEGELTGKHIKSSRSVSLQTACDTVPCTWLRGGASARREGSAMALEAKLELKLGSICCEPMTMVAGIGAGALRQPDPDRPSVIVRPSRAGERLWDIAKYCGSTVSAIQRLNKLEREPEENRLLLIPVI